MGSDNKTKEIIEKQFKDLSDKAKQLYPNIDDTISSYTNIAASSERLQDYLNLTMQTPPEISTNSVVLI